MRSWPWFLLLSLAAMLLLVFGLPHSAPLFSLWFPQLDRPVYRQDDFSSLLLAHIEMVGVSSLIAVLLGTGLGIGATRAAGRAFRPMLETILAISQSLPPVAVLAVATPLLGFGATPALIALVLYGLLPVAQGTLAGLESVEPDTLEIARGLGMTSLQVLWRVELPLAAPVILAGVRTSVTINIGTAAIASTVGAKTLGLPIIIGLSGYNTAYVIQGALLVALLAICADQGFELLERRAGRWRWRAAGEPSAMAPALGL